MDRVIYQDISFFDIETIEKWKAEIREDYPDYSDDVLMQLISDDNDLNWEEDIAEISHIDLPDTILCIGQLGLWNGTFIGYKEYPDLESCFKGHDGEVKFFIDENGDFRAELAHHDGTNHYLFRMWKSSASETARNILMSKIYNKDFSQTDISRYTVRLGDFIGQSYGWAFKGRKSREYLNFLKKENLND